MGTSNFSDESKGGSVTHDLHTSGFSPLSQRVRDLVSKRLDQITENRAIPGRQICFHRHARNKRLAFQLCHFRVINGESRGIVALASPLVLTQIC